MTKLVKSCIISEGVGQQTTVLCPPPYQGPERHRDAGFAGKTRGTGKK